LRFCGAEGTVCTLTVTIVEWLNKPLVPVTVTVYVPAAVVDGIVIVSVDEADLADESGSEDGLEDVIQPIGAVATSVTVSLNSLSDVTVIIELP
jgi:hypothetical protein